MARNRFCDGATRRDFVQAGALGGLGLTLSQYLRASEGGKLNPGKAKACIHVQLGGGPSHMDTFDLKPDAPAEFRGDFKPIATKVSGIQISEHLPKLAQTVDKFAILRGVSHTLAAHEFGTKYVTTGNRPIASLEYPAIGSVVTRELESPKDLPPYVAIPGAPQGPGFLGIAHSAFSAPSPARPGQPYSVRGVALRPGLTITDVERRERLLDDLDQAFECVEKQSDVIKGLDRFGEQAFDMVRSKRAREAFDISLEKNADVFGASSVGQSCLMAVRLIEAGVRFVTVGYGGWDTHQDNFNRLKTRNLPELDTALSALFTTLAARGMLDSTVVYVTGEFGRTPKINKNVGRDHWPRAMFALLAGGGIRGGQVLGESDDKGMGPKSVGITPNQVVASVYHALGIKHTKEYHTNTGRPIMIVRDGEPIKELFA